MTQLIKYEAARAALAEARTVDEVKDLRDKTEATRAYARMANEIGAAKDTGQISRGQPPKNCTEAEQACRRLERRRRI
jgi:hypothetical protein